MSVRLVASTKQGGIWTIEFWSFKKGGVFYYYATLSTIIDWLWWSLHLSMLAWGSRRWRTGSRNEARVNPEWIRAQCTMDDIWTWKLSFPLYSCPKANHGHYETPSHTQTLTSMDTKKHQVNVWVLRKKIGHTQNTTLCLHNW